MRRVNKTVEQRTWLEKIDEEERKTQERASSTDERGVTKLRNKIAQQRSLPP